MPPEQESPYWDAIVGNNWPVISPGDWHALSTTASDGAAAIDPEEAERARRAFDDRVRDSRGLQPVKDEMLVQRGTPRAFVDALVAAAGIYDRMSGLVYRTRNKILDIVDDATRRISRGEAEDTDGDGDNSDEEHARIAGIVADARRAVEECTAKALQEIDPTVGYDPIMPDHPGGPGPGHHDVPGHPGHHPGRPGAPGHPGDPAAPPGGPPGRLPYGPWSNNPDLRMPIGLGPGGPTWPEGETPGSPGHPNEQGPVGSPVVPGPPGTGTAPSWSGGGGGPAGGTAAGHDPASDDTGSDHGAESSHDLAGPDGAAGGRSSDTASDAGDTSEEHSGATDSDPRSVTTGSPDTVPAATMGAGAPLGAPLGILPPAVTAPGSVSTSASAAGANAAQQGATSPGATPDRARTVSAPSASAPPAADARTAGAGPRITAGPQPSGVSATTGKTPPMRPHGPGGPGSEDRDDKAVDATANAADGDTMRDAVGTAMLAAAGPAFVVGQRVSGDLVLARSLLSSLLAATGDTAVGVAWAVSLMRHSGGVSAFVTSNEGRGWLPAGVFLPRELSTPWVWSVSEQAPWEGIADPARILVEFAAAWGVKSGAALSALASSVPLDSAMMRQIGDVPSAGSVEAEPTMDFTSSAGGREDRLGLVGAPRLLDQVAKVRPERIRGRCLELAVDAHMRLGKLDTGGARGLGAPELRQRILAALQRARAVPDEWWAELRDADDLLAATALSLRADVSRITVGQLRSDDSDYHSVTGTAAVRSLAFERRCDELVLLLAAEPTRQTLRDTVFAHGQIIDHPLFGGMAAAAAAATNAAPRRQSAVSARQDPRR
ncbi:hypothetical protein BJY24_007677 [Nocardia transvalensis]|uniref:Uncharacterized protein n=1 Tax=Nocardia transvalensis TaxID=37333 RepID=A0A7W9UNF1_9NOCA|nr:hypothetical protein [Nocardia transvalensis]MBB5918765.1 hypothetical protein [Nocardia transvalensis]